MERVLENSISTEEVSAENTEINTIEITQEQLEDFTIKISLCKRSLKDIVEAKKKSDLERVKEETKFLKRYLRDLKKFLFAWEKDSEEFKNILGEEIIALFSGGKKNGYELFEGIEAISAKGKASFYINKSISEEPKNLSGSQTRNSAETKRDTVKKKEGALVDVIKKSAVEVSLEDSVGFNELIDNALIIAEELEIAERRERQSLLAKLNAQLKNIYDFLKSWEEVKDEVWEDLSEERKNLFQGKPRSKSQIKRDILKLSNSLNLRIKVKKLEKEEISKEEVSEAEIIDEKKPLEIEQGESIEHHLDFSEINLGYEDLIGFLESQNYEAAEALLNTFRGNGMLRFSSIAAAENLLQELMEDHDNLSLQGRLENLIDDLKQERNRIEFFSNEKEEEKSKSDEISEKKFALRSEIENILTEDNQKFEEEKEIQVLRIPEKCIPFIFEKNADSENSLNEEELNFVNALKNLLNQDLVVERSSMQKSKEGEYIEIKVVPKEFIQTLSEKEQEDLNQSFLSSYWNNREENFYAEEMYFMNAHLGSIQKIGEGGLSDVYGTENYAISKKKSKQEKEASKNEIISFKLESIFSKVRELRETGIVDYSPFPSFEVVVSSRENIILGEKFNGNNLEDYLEGEKQIRLKDILEVLEKVSYALSQLNRNGILHGDIKPENVILTDEGEVKVIDFGAAREVEDDSITQFSPDFLYPEALIDEPGDNSRETSDVYSLGVTLYKLMTKNHNLWENFSGETEDVQEWIEELSDYKVAMSANGGRAILESLESNLDKNLPGEVRLLIPLMLDMLTVESPGNLFPRPDAVEIWQRVRRLKDLIEGDKHSETIEIAA